jgi:hypothetical protein
MHLRVLLLLLFLLAALPLSAQVAERSERAQPPHPSCLTPQLLQQQGRAAGNRVLEQESRSDDYDSAPAGRSVSAVSRETRQRQLLSGNRHFRIHYDVTGSNAVSSTDLNGNDVPDYIDSVDFYLEYAWQVEIVEMGYKAPSDKGIQGPEVDVFVDELGETAYGYAYPEFDNEISSSPLRITGFLVIDNDYVGFPTSGIDGLRVTTAHEFHHIIEFSAYRVDIDQLSLYESTATWFEKQVHPDLKDYRNYTDIFLGAPQQFPFSTHNVQSLGTGYGHILYLSYLSERIGRDLVRKIWEEFEKDDRSFTAINSALVANCDLNLETSWCEFARWCYYTGRRAPTDSSMLDEAHTLPTMKPALNRMLDGAGLATIQSDLQPLSFAIERILVPNTAVGTLDTIDFLVTNTRGDIGRGGPQLPREPFVLTVSAHPESGFIPVVRSGAPIAFYRFTSGSPFYCLNPLGTGISSVSAVEQDDALSPITPRTASQPESHGKPTINLQK